MPFMTCPDGLSLFFEDKGEGTAIVFVHGWSAHHGFFREQSSALLQSFRVITLDQRGHGSSPAPEQRPQIEDLSADLLSLLDHLKIEQCVLVGWSMGALVCWDFIARYGLDRIGGLAVVDMTPRLICDDEWALGLRGSFTAEHNRQTLQRMSDDWPTYARHMAPNLFGQKGRSNEALFDWTLQQLLQNDPGTLASLWQSMAQCDYRDLLPRITCPAMVVHGSESALYNAQTAAFLTDRMPDASQHEMAGCGHAPHMENPGEFNQVISDFVTAR